MILQEWKKNPPYYALETEYVLPHEKARKRYSLPTSLHATLHHELLYLPGQSAENASTEPTAQYYDIPLLMHL